MKTSEKLRLLRQLMEKEGVDACLVPSSDAHMSEYVGEHWKSRKWISGFTGSAGTAVITKDDAGLWTDGRYFIQAAQELEGSGIRLFKMTEPGVQSYEEWLAEVLPQDGTLAVDGRTVPVKAMDRLAGALSAKSITFRTDVDLVGQIWQDRPAIPGDRLFLHEDQYAGQTRSEKLAQVRNLMKNRNASYYLLPVLDEICWLFNFRGTDIPYNPYVTSYAVIGRNSAVLFTGADKVPEDARTVLAGDGTQIKEYGEVYSYLKELDSASSILLDPDKTNTLLYSSINPSVRKVEAEGLVTLPKAIKNEVEIRNIRDAYLKDSTALVKLFKWLKDTVPHRGVTEIEVNEKGLEFRSQLPLFKGLSFETISAYGDHAAMMHYMPMPEYQHTLAEKGLFLLDSGSHFLNGTTDITRTLALGSLTEEEKKDFTLVLKSVIALSTAKFLYGSTGSSLDILARKPMWDNGLDYKCGTGHGVGYFSNIHEEPQRFSHKPNMARLEKGMIITVEPGVYKEGRHGIRTENTLLVVEDETTEFGTFLRFETLCYLPIDRSALLPSMLTDSERDWINDYHQEVYNKLSVHLDEEHQQWLKAETAAI
jgi:Xaa-Pro aminopeptidase